MRLLVTADLHYNHARSRGPADELIDRINSLSFDALLVVGDTAPAESDELAQCLGRFTFAGPRLFVAGNHELWTNGPDSHQLLRRLLPDRLQQLGWHDLQSTPFIAGDVAVVGSIGWYDYSLADASLGIPRRFYEAKISPGSAGHLDDHAHLLGDGSDISEAASHVFARWNDGRFVKLHRSDQQFLDELLDELRQHLELTRSCRQVIAAIHHLPFAELMPPQRPARSQWRFALAFLGATSIGQLLLRYANVSTVFCGHSHFAREAQVGHIRAVNIGSGYREKTYHLIEV